MKYLILLIPLMFLSCAKPPEKEMMAAEKIAKSQRKMEEFEYAVKLKEQQDQKFALFRSYHEAKEAFEKIINGQVIENKDYEQFMEKTRYMSPEDKEVIRLLESIERKLDSLCILSR